MYTRILTCQMVQCVNFTPIAVSKSVDEQSVLFCFIIQIATNIRRAKGDEIP